jgi:aspartyl-tRNA(Asn)/glutamyl-tRNA(Gln) amidotransferase subunit C
MGSITKEDVQKIARLSRLHLDEDEVIKYQKELEEILHYVEKLQSADTSGLKPTYQVTGLTNVMRADEEVDYGTTKKELLKNAPDSEDGHFKVKRMVG